MKITRLGPTRPALSIGSIVGGGTAPGGTESPAPPGQVPTSTGSNSVSWGSNVAIIQGNGVNALGPIVNFADGSNTTVSVSSNVIRIHGGAASVSAGSNSTRVSEVSTAGASTTLWSPFDHAHDGIGTITASSSNTLQRGTVNLRSGNNVSFGLTDSDGDGEFDTLTIHGAAAGGGSGSLTVADEGTPLSTSATTLDFVGAGVTASGTGATKTITIAGGSGSSRPYFDTITLHADGDDFEASTLDADWTARGITTAEVALQLGGGSIARWNVTGRTTGTIDRALSSTTEVDIIASFMMDAHVDGMIGPYIVSSTGTGVGAAIRPLQNGGEGFALHNLVSYVYNSAGGNAGATVPAIGGEQSYGHRVWIRLSKRGSDYFAQFSYNGEVWNATPAIYRPSSFTVAKYGFGAWYGADATHIKQVSIDRINIVNQYGVGNNLVTTPTSGTATYSASSEFSGSFLAGNAADGNAGTDWAAASGDEPTIWWQVDWSAGQSLNRVRLFSRGAVYGSGWLVFSDGSSVPFPWYLGATSKCFIDFPTKTGITSMRVETATGGATTGFFEVEAYLAS